MVFWITGLSGAGKSSIARDLVAALRAQGRTVVLLDGDEIRAAIDDPSIGHDRESRLKQARRIARLAKLIENNGPVVVVATISFFHEIHEWNRKNFKNYFEIYVKVDLSVLQERNARGLYEKARQGTEKNIVGLDLLAEEPLHPHLILENNESKNDLTPFVSDILEKSYGKSMF